MGQCEPTISTNKHGENNGSSWYTRSTGWTDRHVEEAKRYGKATVVGWFWRIIMLAMARNFCLGKHLLSSIHVNGVTPFINADLGIFPRLVTSSPVSFGRCSINCNPPHATHLQKVESMVDDWIYQSTAAFHSIIRIYLAIPSWIICFQHQATNICKVGPQQW